MRLAVKRKRAEPLLSLPEIRTNHASVTRLCTVQKLNTGDGPSPEVADSAPVVDWLAMATTVAVIGLLTIQVRPWP